VLAAAGCGRRRGAEAFAPQAIPPGLEGISTRQASVAPPPASPGITLVRAARRVAGVAAAEDAAGICAAAAARNDIRSVVDSSISSSVSIESTASCPGSCNCGVEEGGGADRRGHRASKERFARRHYARRHRACAHARLVPCARPAARVGGVRDIAPVPCALRANRAANALCKGSPPNRRPRQAGRRPCGPWPPLAETRA